MKRLLFFYLLLSSFIINTNFLNRKTEASFRSFFENLRIKKCNLFKKIDFSYLCPQKPIITPKKLEKKSDKHEHHIIPWKKPSQAVSPPPPLAGKQMGLVETPGVKPLGYELDGNVKIFRLIAQPIEQIIVDESHSTIAHLIPKKNMVPKKMKMHHKPRYQKIKCWGYNGSTPGPTLEATEGDRVRIIVKNELPEPTSIHWHGIELPNNQDGAAPETQRPIMPGETYTYEFTLYQSGTVMYHSGYNVMRQDHMGLHGTFVIHPKKYENPIDKQFVIMLQQWAILPGSEYLNLATMDFNWFTFNGHSAPNIPVLTVNQGERVRIRFSNIIMDSHPIHLHGYIWNWVGTEGGPIPRSAQIKGSTILVSAGTTRDVEFIAWNPGIWRFHCHKLHHIVNAHADIPMGIMDHGGMFTLFHVIPKDDKKTWKHPKQKDFQ
ncbi:multicopper oxidase domain-containing protein [Candidatus Dependentiae bacterium]